jgi:hypothetical protein
MVVGNAYVHFYWKFSRGISQGTMKEIGVEGVALYHHQREIVQTRAISNYALMFA